MPRRKIQRRPEVRVMRQLGQLLLDGGRYAPTGRTAVLPGEWVVMMPVGEKPERVEVVRVELDGEHIPETWVRE